MFEINKNYFQAHLDMSRGIFGSDQSRGRPVDKMRNFERKTFSKKINALILWPRPDFRRG